jgi:hypothetical protein
MFDAAAMYVKLPRLLAARRASKGRFTSGPNPTVNTRTSRRSSRAAASTGSTSERPSVKNSTTRGRPSGAWTCDFSAHSSACPRLVPPPSCISSRYSVAWRRIVAVAGWGSGNSRSTA